MKIFFYLNSMHLTSLFPEKSSQVSCILIFKLVLQSKRTKLLTSRFFSRFFQTIAGQRWFRYLLLLLSFNEKHLHCWSLRLFSVVIEMIQVLLDRINRLVGFVYSLIMLVWIDVRRKSIREVSWYVCRRMLTEKALQKFFNKIPTEDWNKTRSVINLYQNSFEILILAHCDTSEFDEKIAESKSGSFCFNLKKKVRRKSKKNKRFYLYHFFRSVNWINFEHK